MAILGILVAALTKSDVLILRLLGLGATLAMTGTTLGGSVWSFICPTTAPRL
jgi:hypothetical protein